MIRKIPTVLAAAVLASVLCAPAVRASDTAEPAAKPKPNVSDDEEPPL